METLPITLAGTTVLPPGPLNAPSIPCIEIDGYRMNMVGAGIPDKSFSIRKDSLEQLRMMIEFANSTTGRNHFKNNYIRHSRLLNQFKEVKQTAKGLIIKINKEIEQTE